MLVTKIASMLVKATEHDQPALPARPVDGRQAVLPRRFRSSALRACGAGRLATGIPGQHAQHAARNIVTVTAPIGRTGAGSYPQFVVMVDDATSAWEVALNTAASLAR